MLMFRARVCVGKTQHCHEEQEMSCLVILCSFSDSSAKIKYSIDLKSGYTFSNPFVANLKLYRRSLKYNNTNILYYVDLHAHI